MVKTVTSQPKIRYEAIDYAKAMLIVLMVVGHIGLYPAFEIHFPNIVVNPAR